MRYTKSLKTGEFHSNITISIFQRVLNAFNVFFIGRRGLGIQIGLGYRNTSYLKNDFRRQLLRIVTNYCVTARFGEKPNYLEDNSIIS